MTDSQRRGQSAETADKWDVIRFSYRPSTEEETTKHALLKIQVTEPIWASDQLRHLHGGENLAEGLGEAIDEDGSNDAEDQEDE